jgi:hypothetical protein
VVPVAVEFDGQSVLRPAAVDVVAVDAPVGLGEREAGSANGGNEGRLELAEAHRLASPDHTAEVPGPSPVVAARDDPLDRVRLAVVPHDRLVERPRQVRWLQDSREVDERSGRVRHGDAAPLRSVPRIDPAAATDGYSTRAAMMSGENFGQ